MLKLIKGNLVNTMKMGSVGNRWDEVKKINPHKLSLKSIILHRKITNFFNVC